MNKEQLNSRVLDAAAIDKLKKKVIEDYRRYIKGLFRGYKNDYSELLNEINFIEIHSEINNQKLIYEYYINYINYGM